MSLVLGFGSMLPNIGTLLPGIGDPFVNLGRIPLGRETCDGCGRFFCIEGPLDVVPVGLPCGHVHCFACTWGSLTHRESCPECHVQYADIAGMCVFIKNKAVLCRRQKEAYADRTSLEQLSLEPQLGLASGSDNDADMLGDEDHNDGFILVSEAPSGQQIQDTIVANDLDAEDIQAALTLVKLQTGSTVLADELGIAFPLPTSSLDLKAPGSQVPVTVEESNGSRYNSEGKSQTTISTPTQRGSFPCTICGKSYGRKDHVKQHERKHTETLTQREERLARQRISNAKFRAKKNAAQGPTVEQRGETQGRPQRSAPKDSEEYCQYLEKKRSYFRQYRANEPEGKRKERLIKAREYQRMKTAERKNSQRQEGFAQDRA